MTVTTRPSMNKGARGERPFYRGSALAPKERESVRASVSTVPLIRSSSTSTTTTTMMTQASERANNEQKPIST